MSPTATAPAHSHQANAAAIAKSLDGIGQTRAQAIVAGREVHGPFNSVKQLSQIKGIGKATFGRDRSAILLADIPATSGKAPPQRRQSTR